MSADAAAKGKFETLKQGLFIGNRGNNHDFWGISWGRPTAFVLLMAIADWRWVTPNLLTHVSNALLLIASGLVVHGESASWLWAALAINLSLTFDCADGQLARYRPPSGKELGSFYDKVSDSFGLAIWFGCLGWAATVQYADLKYFVFAIAGGFGQVVGGYAKWVAMSTLYKRGHVEPAIDSEIPLWQYPGRIALKVLRFAEPDLFFWTGLGLITGHLDWALWLVVLSQPPVAIASVAFRAYQVRQSDLRMAAAS